MDLQPLEEFIARHQLETAPEYCLLDIMAQLGELSSVLLKDTKYGRELACAETVAMSDKIGDLMFAVAYLSSLYHVDPEAAMWTSVARFERKLEVLKTDGDG